MLGINLFTPLDWFLFQKMQMMLQGWTKVVGSRHPVEKSYDDWIQVGNSCFPLCRDEDIENNDWNHTL